MRRWRTSFRRAAWAKAHGKTEEDLKRAEAQAKALRPATKGKLRSQKGEVPPGAETAEIEGWEPFAWKHNALRHSFISCRLAAIQAQVALEAGIVPQIIFRHYRELVRPVEAEKWFAVTLGAVGAVKAEQEKGAAEKIVRLPVVAAA